MEVKYLDLPSQFNTDEVLHEIKSILESCQFVMGPQLEEFEKKFAEACGVKYALGIDNGTNALFIALKILGIGTNDEVITAPNSFLATAGAIVQAGAFPRFVDISDDYNIDPGKIEEAINEKTKAIMPVHLTGNPAKMDEINTIAKKHGLYVIEDSAQAIGASDELGNKAGSLGDMGAFSLHPLKNINTCGDGGVLTTNSEEYYKQALLMRNHGLKNRNEAQFFAYNFRLDSIKAAVAGIRLKQIEKITDQRNKNSEQYDRGLANLEQVIIPERPKDVRQAFHTYVIQVERRDALISYLENRGIETKIHYPMPIHLMEASKEFGYKKGDFPITEEQSEKIITLPINQTLTEEQIEYVIDSISSFYS
ncbi:MAG: DegT/DnrJ/EryC1/StrS family aminotransferase [bacterium]|nr:DegT/DnrJ/EryC1/StrS family aminotransferase [bacterium]